MIKVNSDFENVKESYLFSDIAKKVAAYLNNNPEADIIKLGIGDVTLPITANVVAALKTAADEMGDKATFRGYAPEYGYDFLKEALKEYYGKNGVELSCDEIFISDGAKSDIGNMVEIFGDNPVIIPDPVYPVYLDSNLMSHKKISFINADIENAFLPMPDSIKSTESSVIYLCSPNNPTGAVYTKEQLKQWVDYANKTSSVIVFDCAYEAYISGDYPHSIFEIEGARTCAIEVGSFSKTAGFTGMRCGFTVIPSELCGESASGMKKLSALWTRRQATKFNGVAYVIQRAAEAAISECGMKLNRINIAYYMQNAQILADVLTNKGIYFTGGICSPYIWMKCPNGMNSWQLFDYLLNELNIVGTPGAGFGKCGEGYFRLTSFNSRENTLRAAERMAMML